MLSVEYPTAVSVAHTNRTYSSANEYLGFFDPNKCYTYTAGATDAEKFFTPSALAALHVCSGRWSGNFLNWASMQTIDPFRWVLTGGYRVIDEATRTVVEKAWASGQGGTGNFPDSTLGGADAAGATPFPATVGTFYMRIQGLGNKMRFTVPSSSPVKGNKSPTVASMEDPATATPYDGTATAGGVVYETFMRARVCDKTLGVAYLETNCTPYGVNHKPEGLLQKYSNKIRYSAFGYLNDGNIQRDGGVLRAQQKFVGPTTPVPGSPAVTNVAREWDETTGVFTINPDSADATATAAIFGTINNSGVINYLNKFGQITPGDYKTYDNVSELYYAAIRYFKALPNVPEWTAVGSASTTTKATWADGFPVITSPADPILYSCQKNFVLGIGDVNTHADKNLPGRLANQTNPEPPLPATVSSDTSVNAVTATDKVGALEGLGTIGTNATYNTAAIAGLAYDSHVRDIRPDDASKSNTKGKQTIDTYWVDVQEYQEYKDNNQFYLATKYGGFTVPSGFDPNTTVALTEAWWHTNPDTLVSNKRPDNYFAGGRPDLVKAGLDAAFSKIAAAITAFTTSFSTSLPQVALSGNSSFSSKYDANNWTGEITASTLSFDAATNAPTLVEQWKFTDILATQLAGTGWNLNRRVFTWNGTAGVAFRDTKLAAADLLALDTSYITGDDSVNYLKYLRGDRTNEITAPVLPATATTGVYRTRSKLLGDIVGSKARPVGAPSFPFSDATNPGYSAFKSTWSARRTVVYVGSNDGMMHAINGALLATATTPATLEADANRGKEMFAYVPRALFQGPSAPTEPNTDGLASLGKTAFAHRYMVNTTPSVNDLDFSRVPNILNAKQTPLSTVSDWRTVLIGGLGKGGKSYYALDVTDPVSMATAGTEDSVASSKVLWEFGNSTTGMSNELGYSYGDPLVMKTQKYGWVVVFLSGYNNADGKGYFIFVNPKTGALLEKVSTGTGTTSADAGLTHANAFIVDASDGTADAIYAGDLLGNLWRLDVTGQDSYSANGKLVKLAVLTDASANPQPVTSKPSIEVHPGSTKKRFVMVGTGRLLDPTDEKSVQGQSFYAIADGTNASFNATPFPPSANPVYPITRTQLALNSNAISGITFDPAKQVGWYEELGVDTGTPAVQASGSNPAVPAIAGTNIAWRVTSDSTSLAGSVAFAAILPNGSVCSPSGNSRVYARDYALATTTVKALVTGVLAPVLYVPVTGNVTDLRYLSVRGRAVLLSGADTGELKPIDINPLGSLSLRRLNWRELQVVD